jgi:flagellar hook-associated protein 1 FlgK
MAFESIYLGSDAMRAAQGALSVIGHNISNLNTEGYTRQRAELVTKPPLDIYPGQLGTGVQIDEIRRLTDEFARRQLDVETQDLGRFTVKSELLDQLEQVMTEPSDGGLQSALSDFFNAFHILSNQPEEYSNRNIVLGRAASLADSIHSLDVQLKSIRDQADEYVEIKVDEINSLSDRIARLNRRIASGEVAEGQNANDLRDSRDLLYRQLSELINVTSFEDDNNVLFVETQGAVLVAGTRNVELAAIPNEDGVKVAADARSGTRVDVRSGELKGIYEARDEVIGGVIDDLDALSKKLIEEVNRVHSRGSTLEGFETVTGDVTITNPNANLVNAELSFTPVNGSLFLSAYNSSTGAYEEHEIAVDPFDDSMNDVITRINTAFGGTVTASLTADNRLRFDAASGYRLQFVEGSTGQSDTSDLLLAAGVNTFFEGDSSYTLDVKSGIRDNPGWIAAGRSLSAGDNTNALLLAGLAEELVLDGGQSIFQGFYAGMVTGVGSDALDARQDSENQDALVQMLEQRLQSTAGVSLEEEAASLMIYQRMFQAAAKYVQVMDTVMETVVTGLK